MQQAEICELRVRGRSKNFMKTQTTYDPTMKPQIFLVNPVGSMWGASGKAFRKHLSDALLSLVSPRFSFFLLSALSSFLPPYPLSSLLSALSSRFSTPLLSPLSSLRSSLSSLLSPHSSLLIFFSVMCGSFRKHLTSTL